MDLAELAARRITREHRARVRLREITPHTVYRLCAIDGAVLYVGCTSDLDNRLAGHRSKPWWRDVAEVRTKQYKNKQSARAAELELIHRLLPPHNSQGKPRARRPPVVREDA